jgi:hypothetical protein
MVIVATIAQLKEELHIDVNLQILITPLVSFDHYVVCPMIYGF